jgi:rhodanese-like protein
MKPSTVTFLDLELSESSDEEAFHAWWREARSLIQERAKPLRLDLLVTARGKYSIVMELQFPGGFKLVSQDRPWQELEARRPPATATVRDARIWGPHDVTTATLRRWLDDRRAGTRDLVLIDALGEESFAKKHLAGAINLPVATIDAATAAAAIGTKNRQIVVYCGGYT